MSPENTQVPQGKGAGGSVPGDSPGTGSGHSGVWDGGTVLFLPY